MEIYLFSGMVINYNLHLTPGLFVIAHAIRQQK